jgi:hypothetical protein
MYINSRINYNRINYPQNFVKTGRIFVSTPSLVHMHIRWIFCINFYSNYIKMNLECWPFVQYTSMTRCFLIFHITVKFGENWFNRNLLIKAFSPVMGTSSWGFSTEFIPSPPPGWMFVLWIHQTYVVVRFL